MSVAPFFRLAQPAGLAVALSLFFAISGQVQGGEVINAGQGGQSSRQLLQRFDRDVASRHADLVIILVGTNDMVNPRKFATLDEYRANLIELVQAAREAKLGLILVTPPPCIEAVVFSRHDEALYGGRGPARRLAEAVEVMREVAASEKVPLADFYQKLTEEDLAGEREESVIRNPRNKGGRDGVHPNVKGYRILAELVFQKINEAGFSDSKKVVCFGDSITYGAGMRGKGTATGETYPAFLSRLLN